MLLIYWLNIKMGKGGIALDDTKYRNKCISYLNGDDGINITRLGSGPWFPKGLWYRLGSENVKKAI